jgi:hypothetical protein
MPLADVLTVLMRDRSAGGCRHPLCPCGPPCRAALADWRDARPYGNAIVFHNGHTNCTHCYFGGWVAAPEDRCRRCRSLAEGCPRGAACPAECADRLRDPSRIYHNGRARCVGCDAAWAPRGDDRCDPCREALRAMAT